MPSDARTKFTENTLDINQLATIHAHLGGPDPGRRRGLEVLNRAAVVFVAACWESFVEDLAAEASELMLSNVGGPDDIPVEVRLAGSDPLRAAKDSRAVWQLAGDGWRDVLREHRANIIAAFHSPRTENVDALFERLLGIRQVSRNWYWRPISARRVSEKLDYYIDVRGRIAHRLRCDDAVHRTWPTDFLNHVERLCDITDDIVRGQLLSVTGRPPW